MIEDENEHSGTPYITILFMVLSAIVMWQANAFNLFFFLNIYCLLVFADNIEYVCGRLRYIAFLALGMAISVGCDYLIFSRPVLSLSTMIGAVATMIGAYCYGFPKVKIRVMGQDSLQIFTAKEFIALWFALNCTLGFFLVFVDGSRKMHRRFDTLGFHSGFYKRWNRRNLVLSEAISSPSFSPIIF